MLLKYSEGCDKTILLTQTRQVGDRQKEEFK